MILHCIHTKNLSIFEQLQMEEQLLRDDTRNFCIINEGSSPAIVMGISGKPEELIHKENTQQRNYPVIKRFSGGGTVIVDDNTLFVSFICNKSVFDFPAYPERILKWSEGLYQEAFSLSDFHLRENDFVIGEKKCGGNAQYIKKERWLQHTSFLWDFCEKKMECLLHPRKTPTYRQGRGHDAFLCKLKDFFRSKETVTTALKKTLSERYELVSMPYIQQSYNENSSTRRSTTFLSLFEKDPS